MKLMAKITTLLLLVFAFFQSTQANAQSILDPSDPLITYNSASPPTEPAWGKIGKWVRTKRLSYNTDSWKAYIYKTIPFRLKYPKTYNPTANDGKKYPMIVFFHGAGESGTKYDNEFSLANGGPVFTAAVDNGSFDGYVLVMQMPGSGWSQSYIDFACELADYMIVNNKLDPFRIMNNGLSAGAGGCWDMTIRHPNYVAASLPMSGIGVGHKDSVNVYKFTPIWYFQGGQDKSPDPNTALEVKAVIDQVGANFKYTLYPSLGHGTWTTAWSEPDFFPFCSRAYAANPWTLKGRTEFCPGDPINVTIGVAPYYSAYQWRKDGVVISGATGNSIQATSVGTYEARILKGTVWSEWSRIPVVIKLKAPTVTPPIAISGLMSKVIPALDTANVSLKVPDGYVSYDWQKVGNNTTIGTDSVLNVSTPGDYIVRVTEQFGCSSSFSSPFTVINANGPNKPSAAGNVIATALSKTSIRLDWSDNPSPQYNETNYEIYQGTQAGGSYKLVGIVGADITNFTITGLTPNVRYYYKVRAVNNSSASAASNEASAKTDVDAQAPTAPGNLSVVSTTRTSVSLAWDASTDDVGVVRYEVYVNGAKSYTTTSTDFVVNGLQNKKSYNFVVRAIDGAGNQSANSNQVTAQPVLNGIDYKYYTFTGNWTQLPDFNTLTPDVIGVMPNIAITPRTQNDNFAFLWEGYINIPVSGTYYFRTNSDDGSRLYLGSLNGTVSPYSYAGTPLVNNDGLHGGQNATSNAITLTAGLYPIAVSFFEQGGGEAMTVSWRTPSTGNSFVTIPNSAFTESPANNGSSPASPSNLVATATAFNKINLTWTDNSNNETGFEIWRSTSLNSGFSILATTPANTNSYVDNSVSASTTYYYQIKAIGQFGESALVDNLIDPEASWLLNNSYSDASGNGRTLSATSAPTFDAADKKEGTHSLKLNGTSQYVTIPTSGSFLQTSYSQKTVAFWMKSTSNTGNRIIVDIGGSDDGLALMLNSNTLIAGIVSNNQTSNRKSFSVPYTSTGWNHVALVYNSTSLKLYINGVEVGANNSLPFSSVTSTTNGSRIGTVNSTNALNTGTGFFGGWIDNFQIFSSALSASDVNKIMNNFPAGQSFATTAALPAVPATPNNLLASAISTNVVTVNWTDNANNENGYEVFRSNNNNSNYLKIASLPANSASYADTGLFANAIYYYKVRAIGVGGNSVYSNEDSAATWNNKPIVTPITNKSMHYSTTMDVAIQASDSDGENITLVVNNLPAFASFQSTGNGTGKITFAPNGTQGTFNNVTVVATDGHGGTGSASFNLTVNDNYNPVIDNIGSYTVSESQTISIPLSATDQNASDVLTWSVANLPDNFTVNQGVANGSATLQITPTFAAAGTYTVQVNVNDGKGGSGTKTFSLTVVDKDPTTRIYTRIKYANTMSAPWNNITGITTNNLVDEKGNTTSVGLNFLQSWWMPYNAGPTTGNNSGVYPDGVLNDFWYFGYYGGPETASVAVTGLDPAKKYNLTFYAGSVFDGYSDNGTTNYTVGSKTVSLYVQNNTKNTVTISNISPDANGAIRVDMAKAANTPIGYLNALVIGTVYDDGTAPATPKSLVAQNVSGQGVKLTWQDVPYNETGFEIYRSSTQAGPYSLLTTADANTETYIDNTVSGGSQYYYKIRAINTYGNSSYTDIVSITTINRIPQLNVINDVQLKTNQSTAINVVATDDATDHISLSVKGLPSFATFNDNGNGTGVINIQPTASSLGVYQGITVTATDNSDSSRSVGFNIYVVDADISSTYVNITKDNFNAPAPWNNLVIPFIPYAGLSMSNLKDDANNNTGMTVTLTDAWDGTAATGMRLGNGTEIYPEEVSRASVYTTGTATKRITVTGLDNNKRYNFVFYASHYTSESTLTNFTINGQTVSLNGSYNSNKTVQINGVIPSSGQVVINIAKDASAIYGLISGMVIQSYTPNAAITFSPTDLRVTNSTTNSISLQWQDRADNETGYEVWRANDGGSYSLITTLASNTTSYVNTGLSTNTTYNYIVRAKNGLNYSGYSREVRGYTYSSQVFINVCSNNNAASSPWNNLNWIYGIGASWSNFKNELGIPTNIGMVQPVKIDGMVSPGVNTGNNSGIYPDKVMAEGWGMFPGTTAYVKLNGLNLSKTYDLTVFASLTGWAGENTTAYIVNGKTYYLNSAGNKSGTLTIYGVKPDDNGEITFSWRVEAATFGLVGALVVNAYDPSSNPIPVAPSLGVKNNFVTTANITSGKIAADIVSDDKKVSAYPNPFNQNFTLLVPAKNNEDVQVIISDVNGKTVYQNRFGKLSAGNNQLNINVSEIQAPGLYIVRVMYLNSKKENVIKLIKK